MTQTDTRDSAAKRGYGRRWQAYRERYLAAHPLCVMHQEQGRVVASEVVDHIEPPRLREALDSGVDVAIAKARGLFWDPKNHQALCKTCHDRHKQRLEKSGAVIGCGIDGIPIDRSHHWHRG